MNDFASRLTGKPASALSETFAELLSGERAASGAELDLLTIAARIEALEKRRASMTTREKLDIVEAATRKGRRKSKRRRTTESDIDRNCTELAKLIARAFQRDEREAEQRLGGRVRESRQARRRTKPTQSVALREQLSLGRPNVSLEEALRLVPKPRGSSDLPGEIWRQHKALSEGGEPGLQKYVAERRRLIGF